MNHPLLYFPDEVNNYHAERIPIDTGAFIKKFSRLRIVVLSILGRDLYWKHVRYLCDVEDMKRLDLQFLKHVEDDHAGQPEDTVERRMYEHFKLVYKNEYEWIKHELAHEYTSEYAMAYRARWLDRTVIPEWKLLFHGVSWNESLNIIEEDLKQQGVQLKKLLAESLAALESKS